MPDLLLVHIGAGNHSYQKRHLYRKLIKKALSSDGFMDTSIVLESSPLTNTGYGSSLNYLGEVECDASFIRHTPAKGTESGSCVGMNTSEHPISETIDRFTTVWNKYDKLKQFGLTKPVSLTEDGFSKAAKMLGIAPPDQIPSLVSKEAKQFYDLVISKLEDPAGKKPEYIQHEGVSDTIGLVRIDSQATEIGTSSGGNFFKFPGRVGCAGIIGAAIDFSHRNGLQLSCMCSGNGEDIVTMKLASTIVSHEFISDDIGAELTQLIKTQAENYQLLAMDKKGTPIIYVGVVLAINDTNTGKIKVVYCHSTESFYFGFKGKGESSQIFESTLPDPLRAGHTFAYGECKV